MVIQEYMKTEETSPQEDAEKRKESAQTVATYTKSRLWKHQHPQDIKTFYSELQSRVQAKRRGCTDSKSDVLLKYNV